MSGSPAAPTSRKRRFFRWLLRGGFVALVLVVLVRATLSLWLPGALEATLRDSGIAIRYEGYDLALLGGDVEFRHVDVSLSDGSPLAHVEYACVDVDVSGFLFLEARVHRVELDGLEVSLRRRADGSWELPRPADVGKRVPAADAEVDETGEADQPWSLAPGFRLDALRVQHARLRLIDERSARDSTVEWNVRVSDVGHPIRPALVSVQASSVDLADAFVLEGAIETSDARAVCDAEIAVRGSFGGAIAAACAEAGLWTAEQDLTAGAKLRIVVDSARDRPRIDAVLELASARLEVDRRAAIERCSLGVRAEIEPRRVGLALEDCTADVHMASLVEPLHAHGIVGVATDAKFAAAAELEIVRDGASLGLNGTVHDVSLRSDRPWFELATASFEALVEPSRTTLRRALVDGLDVPLSRGDGGGIAFLGVQSIAMVAGGAVESAEVMVQPSPEPGESAGFAVEDFTIRNARVRWLDERIEGGEIELALEGSLAGLTIGGDAGGHAEIDLAFESARIGRVDVDATIDSKPGPIDLDTTVVIRAERLDLTSLEPAIGRDLAAWRDSAFSLAASAGIRGIEDVIEVDARVRGVEVARGGAPFLRVGGVRLANSRFGGDLELGSLEVGSAQWFVDADRTVELSATLSKFEFGEPAAISVRMSCDGDLARFGGTVTLDGERVEARLEVDSDLAGRGGLASLLPPDRYFAFDSAKLRGSVELRSDAGTDGGRSVSVVARGIELAPAGVPQAPFEIGEIVVDAPRIDADAIRVREFAVRGIGIDALLLDSSVELAGLGLLSSPNAIPSPVDPAAADVGPADDASDAWPRIDVEKFEVGIDRLVVREPGGPGLRFEGSLRNRAPVVVFSDDPETIEPWNFVFRASEARSIEELVLGIELAPWQLQPRLALDLEVRGVHRPSIGRALPSVLGGLEFDQMAAGRLTAALEARLEVSRRSPLEFDLARGFGLEAQLRGLEYRASQDGELLAGVDSVFVDAPRLGGLGAQHVRELSIDGVHGRVERDADGWSFLGLRVPTAAGPSSPPAEDEPGAVGVVDASSRVRSEPSSKPLRVDRFELQGLAFEYEDRSCDPILRIPIVDASVSVTGFRRGEENPPPTRVSASVRCGKVELPQRTKASSVLAGLLSAAGAALVGTGDEAKTEPRTVLQEFVVDGTIVPTSPPRGQLVAEVVGFELLALRGLAKRSGVEIGGGVLDTRVAVEFHESGRTETRSSIRFQDLAVDEPPGGPISTYLKLPAPLQSVVFVLEDEDDRISIPLDVTVDSSGGVSATAIASEAVLALGGVIADAIAASPFRVAGIATGLFTSDQEDPARSATAAVSFEPGAARVADEAVRSLHTIVDLALDDDELRIVLQPILGSADLDRARVLAMPDEQDREAVVDALRHRKLQLWRERDRVASRADALRALGREFEAERARLRQLDAALADCETALDSASALLRPGAERRVERRGRRFATDLAAARAESLRARIVELHGDDLAGRIELRRPRLPDAGLEHGAVVVSLRRSAE